MRLFRFNLLIALALTLVSCEDLIDIDLNKANPKIVIEADLNNLSSDQVIWLSETVDFDSPVASQPVIGAAVVVKDSQGREFIFEDQGDGAYRRKNFKPKEELTYHLIVDVKGQVFLSSTKMTSFVSIDSLAIKEETIFNDIYYSVVLKFEDTKDVPNYYKYDISVNGSSFKFASTFSDKFNDGLYVSHNIADRDNSLALGDSVIVRRQCVAKEVYTYWNQVQMLNPGSAAPANPTSNISNGALGFFSVSSAKDYGVKIVQITD